MLTIDVHSHVFNASDLPVSGFLRAQAPGLPKVVFEIVEKLLYSVTPRFREFRDSEEIEVLSDEETDAILDELLEQYPELAGELGREQQDAQERGMVRGPAKLMSQIRGAIRWVHLLTQSRQRIADILLRTYEEVDLTTPLMMDIDKWVDDEARTDPPARVSKLEELIRIFGGKLHPFVSFDPRRAIEEEADPLGMVRDAVETKGFLGVKLYPPMGFRPTGNEDTNPPLTEPGRYNAVLDELFAYCSSREVPITAHCSPGGAETGPATGLNSNPVFWRPVLENHPELRVNFAHFGGVENLLEAGSDGWAWEISQMMGQFEHVYADTGHHGLFDRSDREQYLSRLRALFEAHPIVRRRLMYGTDWHMIVRTGKHRRFFRDYRDFYERLVNGDAVAIEDFFGGNAVVFLGLDEGGAVRRRLMEFYATNDLNHPQWLAEPPIPRAKSKARTPVASR